MEDDGSFLENYPPESQLHKIDAKLTYCKLGTKNMSEPYHEEDRMHIEAKDFYMAQIIGCTFSTINSNKFSNPDAKELVLDAGASRFIFDEENICIGMNVAIADGLGHGVFEEENLETASVAKNAVGNFIERWNTKFDNDDFTFLHQLVKSSKANVPLYNRNSRDASLSGGCIQLKDDRIYQAKFCHIGDGMVIIYRRKTNDILVLPAIHYDEFYNEKLNQPIKFSPISLSRATKVNCIIKKIDGLEPNDVIILMTDGYWGELDLEVGKIEDLGVHPQKPSCHILKREIRVKIETFKKLLKSIEEQNPNSSALDYASIIHQYVTGQIKNKNTQLLAYAALMKNQHLTKDDSRTIQEWVKSFDENHPMAVKTKWFIKQTHVGDGKSIDPHFTQVRDLKKLVENELETGDDATLQVVILPDPKVELLRRAVEHPASLKFLIPRIQRAIKIEELSEVGELLYQQQLDIQHPIYSYNEIQHLVKKIRSVLMSKNSLAASSDFWHEESHESEESAEERHPKSPRCTIS
jgi:hypothetical protein